MSATLLPIYVCGPTASGKTGTAITLANALDGEIVNADAYQVYRGLELISAAPSADELASAPHHLFSVIDTSETCDAMRYREMAQPVVADIIARGKTPIITGGSGLYLKFLSHGPSPVPASDPVIRAQLEKLSDPELIAQLTELDPVGAEQTNLLNRRYVIRALEICLISGEKMSDIKSTWKTETDKLTEDLRGISLDWPADTLRERIALRTTELLSPASIAEVEACRADASITCAKAIGFSEICDLLDGKITEDECRLAIDISTRRYAKRQRTWFRREGWLTSLPCPASAEQIIATLES